MPPFPIASKQLNCTLMHQTTHRCGLKQHHGRATSSTAPQPQLTRETSHHTRCGMVHPPPWSGVAVPQTSRLPRKASQQVTAKAQDCYYVGPGVNHPRDCMRVLTANRSILTTRNVTWRHVPLPPPAPPQQLPPIAEERGSTAGEGESGEGAPSQGGGRVEEDLDGESDLDVTEVGPMLTAMRKTETAETGAGAGGVAEGNPAASSDPPRSNSTRSRISSTSSNSTSTSRGDVPTLAGREAHR